MSLVLVQTAFLTRREVAEHLGVSVRTVARMEQEGLPVERWSARLVRYRLDRVQGWLEQRSAA